MARIDEPVVATKVTPASAETIIGSLTNYARVVIACEDNRGTRYIRGQVRDIARPGRRITTDRGNEFFATADNLRAVGADVLWVYHNDADIPEWGRD